MADVIREPLWLRLRDQFSYWNDFSHYTTAQDGVTSLAADTNATVAIDADGVGGILVIGTGDAIDNNEAGVLTTNELFLAAAGKPLFFETRIQFTEPTNNVANVAAGLADVFGAANTLLDNGGGPPTSFYGAMIYKVDGETVWRAAASAGTLSSTGTVTQSGVTAGGAAYQRLGIRIEPISGAFNSSRVSYFVDGLQLTDTLSQPISHVIAHGAAATGEMNAGVYAKSGDGVVNNFQVLVDYLGCDQKR